MLIQKRPLGTIAYMAGTPAILEKFSWSFLQLALYSNDYLCDNETYIHYDRSKVSYHAKARNELCQNIKGDWIFMTDSDHQPEPDILARMLHLLYKYKIEVLCGIYQVKVFPFPPLIYMWDKETRTEFDSLISSFDKTGEIFEIGAAGAGCLLIRRNVIARILEELKTLPFDPCMQRSGKRMLSEDLSFFKRCDDLNIKVYAATNVENPHLEIFPITMESCANLDKSGVESKEKMETVAFKKDE